MATASVNEIDLYYEVFGSGPRLLFLNGTGATLAKTSSLISPLIGDFTVAAFDQRGLGRSSLPDNCYSVADLAADALALADHLQWRDFRLMGLSFGGMVAQELAATAPGRVERLALLCTSSGGAGGSSFPLETLAEMDLSERATVSAQILDTRFTSEWLDQHDADRALASLLTQHFTAQKSDRELREESMQLGARSRHNVYERLSRIDCPTLVAAGRFDGIAPMTNSVAIASRISHATLQVFEGGHMFFVQDPTAFPEIISFLMGD
jgi:3-oxoadipate enol-lactonase